MKVIPLSERSQEGLVRYMKTCRDLSHAHWDIKTNMAKIDAAYMREQMNNDEHRRAEAANSAGDATKLQNVEVPVVMPQVESAVTHQTAVFLTGTPLFPVVASPEYMDAALQLETIIDNQAVRGTWARELMMMFRDGFKYNLSAVEVTWDREITAAIETDLDFDVKEGKPKEVIWEGNRVKRLDPYNLLFDVRVPVTKIHLEGEFAGYVERKSRIATKDFLARLPNKIIGNVKAALESSGDANSYYEPTINPKALMQGSTSTENFDWEAWMTASRATASIEYKNSYYITTLYGRILPADFSIVAPGANTPQVWKFIYINNILISAERQTNAHAMIPILFSQPAEDGLNLQTKSLAQNVKPIQEISTTLLTSVIEARRRAISDRTLYDPSRIRSSDINNPNPTAKIPVRPSAFGKSLAEAVYPFPFRDDNSVQILQELPIFAKFADTITGQNQAQQGQFVKGNKTRHEYNDVMSNANTRPQATSILLEAQTFIPMKEILKVNILQYQGGTSLYNRNKKETVKIDPVVLRNAVLQFKIADGLTPTDKLINADGFQTALQVIGSSPQIATEYRIGKLFSYLMKTQGADISEFEKDPQLLQYEQATQAWQQTVMQLLKQNPELQQSQLPPQPKPADFGLGANGETAATEASEDKPKPSIIEQVLAITNQQSVGATNEQTTTIQS